jgi:hypothetical protein
MKYLLLTHVVLVAAIYGRREWGADLLRFSIPGAYILLALSVLPPG